MLQQPAVPEAEMVAVADDDMVENPDAEQVPGLH
jgi:hypothetical protein